MKRSNHTSSISSVGSEDQNPPPSRQASSRSHGPVMQGEQPPASASASPAAAAARAARSGRPELVNDASGLPLPRGMLERESVEGESTANARGTNTRTSSIVEKVRRFENEMRRRQLELDAASQGCPSELSGGTGDTRKKTARGKPDLIEDDDPAPIPLEATASEMNYEDDARKGKAKKGVEIIDDNDDAPVDQFDSLPDGEEDDNIKKKPAAVAPGQMTQARTRPIATVPLAATQSQHQSQPQTAVSPSHPNQLPENNQDSSNTVQGLGAQDQASARPRVRPTPQSMLPRPSETNENESSAPPIFHEVEARLVEEEPPAPIYEATVVRTNLDIEEGQNNIDGNGQQDTEAEVPWWKRNQRNIVYGIGLVLCVIVAVMGTLLGTQGKGTANSNDSESDLPRDGAEPTKSPVVLLDPISPVEGQIKNETIQLDPTSNGEGLFDRPSDGSSAMPLDSNSSLGELTVATTSATISANNTLASSTTSTTGSTSTISSTTSTTATNEEIKFESGGDPVAGYEYVGEGSCLDDTGKYYPFISTPSTSDGAACGSSCDRFLPVGEPFRGFSWNTGYCRCYFDIYSDLEGSRSTYGSEADEIPSTNGLGTGVIDSHDFSPTFSKGPYCYKVVSATDIDEESAEFEFSFEEWVTPERPTVTTSSMIWKQKGQDISGEVDSVSFSADGMILAIGNTGNADNSGRPTSSGQVKVYGWDKASLNYKQVGDTFYGNDHERKGRALVHDNSNFGLSVSLSGNGKVFAVGGYENYVGYVKVYGWDRSYYRQLGKSIFSESESEYDGFGSSVILSADGKTLAIAAYGPIGPSFVKIYGWEEATFDYVQLGDTLMGDFSDEFGPDEFGRSLSLSANGKTLAVGTLLSRAYGYTAGKVEVFGWDEAALKYNQLGDSLSTEKEKATFGYSVSLSADGKTLAVGAPTLTRGGNSTGFVRIYVWDEGASNFKGLEGAADGNSPNNWWEEAFLDDYHGQTLFGDTAHDYFGYSVSLSADSKTLAIGAPQNIYCASSVDKKGYLKVYEWDEASLTYKELHNLNGEAGGDMFGTFVSLSADGHTLAEAGGNMGGCDASRNEVNVFNLVPGQISEEDPLLIGPTTSTSSTSSSKLEEEIQKPTTTPPNTASPMFSLSKPIKLLGDDADGGDSFGKSVGVFGDTFIVGAPYGKNNDDGGGGVAYIFASDASNKAMQLAKLVPNDGKPGDVFGMSVAIHGDSAAIGAWGTDDNGSLSGSVYVFVKNTNNDWSQQAKLLPNDGAFEDYFGRSVGIYENTIVVGANYGDDSGDKSGSAYVFVRDWKNQWKQEAKLVPRDGSAGDVLGWSVSIYKDTAVVGAYGDDDKGSRSGSAYIFIRDLANSWTEQAKLVANDGSPDDEFGKSIAIDEDTVIVGAGGEDNSGSAYIFARDTMNNWTQQAKLMPNDKSANDAFGRHVAIKGNLAIVTAPTTSWYFGGSIYSFVRDGSKDWTQQTKLSIDGEMRFGCSIAINSNAVIVGACGDPTGRGEAAFVLGIS